MGRKRKAIDPVQVEKLARLGCTNVEIGDILGCAHDLLERRFASHLARARAARKMSLRRAQTIRAVRDRSDTMLIHLGKCELGQKPAVDGGALHEILDGLLGQGEGEGGPGEVSG